MKEIILYNQSILDVALQHTGTVESSFEIATRNGFSVSDQLEAGISIEIPENVLKNTDVVNTYNAKKIEPATDHSDIGDSEIPTLKGIGYMQIGNKFLKQVNMNATLQELIGLILSLKESNPHLQGLSSTSKTAVWRNMLETVAFMIFNFQQALRLHIREIDEKIATQKIPNEKWYREKALYFQYGFELDPDSYTGAFLPTYKDGNGNVIVATEQNIEDSRIIKYASVTPNISGSGMKRISMKIAGENMDEIIPTEKALAFKTYIERIQATGDHIVVVNFLPDILLLQYKICYDPLIMHPDGMSILTAEYPVKIAIERFLKNLPFNGELSVEALENALQSVNGVKDLQKLQVSSKWIEPGAGYGLFQPIEISRIPRSGRFKIEDWSQIQYINYTPSE